MNYQPSLADLHEGQLGRVTYIASTGAIRRRLQDLGIIEGTPITCLQKSPAGDPIAYFIRGAAIALRREDSSGVKVSISQ